MPNDAVQIGTLSCLAVSLTDQAEHNNKKGHSQLEAGGNSVLLLCTKQQLCTLSISVG